jgi:hypothetical protein
MGNKKGKNMELLALGSIQLHNKIKKYNQKNCLRKYIKNLRKRNKNIKKANK